MSTSISSFANESEIANNTQKIQETTHSLKNQNQLLNDKLKSIQGEIKKISNLSAEDIENVKHVLLRLKALEETHDQEEHAKLIKETNELIEELRVKTNQERKELRAKTDKATKDLLVRINKVIGHNELLRKVAKEREAHMKNVVYTNTSVNSLNERLIKNLDESEKKRKEAELESARHKNSIDQLYGIFITTIIAVVGAVLFLRNDGSFIKS